MRIEQHYTIKQVAELLACSEKTIRRLLKRGLETGGRLGIQNFTRLETGRIRIPESSVNAYMERQRCQG
jgi:excisionase family DNA binding protein